MADKNTVRNFFGRVHVEPGSMNRGAIVVAEDSLGPIPIASVSIPMRDQRTNLAVAEFIADAWNNDGLQAGR